MIKLICNVFNLARRCLRGMMGGGKCHLSGQKICYNDCLGMRVEDLQGFTIFRILFFGILFLIDLIFNRSYF